MAAVSPILDTTIQQRIPLRCTHRHRLASIDDVAEGSRPAKPRDAYTDRLHIVAAAVRTKQQRLMA